MALLLKNARIQTFDAQRSAAEAVLIRDGRIAAIGSLEQAEAAGIAGAQVVDAGRATILPGFIDAHCHLTQYLWMGADCGPEAAPDIASVRRILREAAVRTPSPSWVVGSGYLEYKLREGRHPTRIDLDAAVPDRPCVLLHASLHVCVVNSRGLEEQGIDELTPDPPDGSFGRDTDGRLNGILFEGPMMRLLGVHMNEDLARMPGDARIDVVRRSSEYFAAHGITSCVEANVGLRSFEVLRSADEAGALKVRVAGMVDDSQIDEMPAGPYPHVLSPMLRLNGIKVFADGGMSSRTAAISGEYPVPPYGSGVMWHSAQSLRSLVAAADRRGMQVAVHAQGDRAIATTLDAFAPVIGDGGNNLRRHRIEHAGAIFGKLIDRAAQLHVVVASQPGFLSALGDGFAEAFPADRDRLYPFRSLRRAGMTVAGSSDAPVIAPSVLTGLRDAAMRQTEAGVVLGPDERLGVDDALEMYTDGAARAAHWESEIGSLEVGKWADFVVLADDPREVMPADIPQIPILATVVGGRRTFGSDDFYPLTWQRA
ncbi:MAG: amidohydrolase [Chloroflexota bacterium]|nr:amidohydrolase [Chloroflexota bacterium]